MSGRSSGSKPRSLEKGRYTVAQKIGKGCFGDVHLGRDTVSNRNVAIKFEPRKGEHRLLDRGADILKRLNSPAPAEGFTELYHFGTEGSFNCMVIELLGKTLEDHLLAAKGVFTVVTAVLIAEQVLRRIEYLHSKGIVHRDIKPENFMCGLERKIHHVYLIDFGLSKAYISSGTHAPCRTKLPLTGTARYASINAHRGMEQSRRDDLEAIGYMLMYFLRGQLPWSGLDAKTVQEKYKKILGVKQRVPLPELCKGFPLTFAAYISCTRSMGYADRPDYALLRQKFAEERLELARAAGKEIKDTDLQWCEGEDVANLVPLQPWKSLVQPDAPRPATEGLRALASRVANRCVVCPCA